MSNQLSKDEIISELQNITRILNDGRLEESDARYQADLKIWGLLVRLDSKFIA